MSKFDDTVSTSNGAPPMSDEALIFCTGTRAFGISTRRSLGRESVHACPPKGSIRRMAIVSARLLPRGSTSLPKEAGSSGSSPSAESTPIIKKLTGSDELVSVSSTSPENWIRPRSATLLYSSSKSSDAPIDVPIRPTHRRIINRCGQLRRNTTVSSCTTAPERSARDAPAEISPRAGDGSRHPPKPQPVTHRR